MGFYIYEACVGAFWPSMGTLKGKYIPEQVRATVMNYFRIPTNLFVLVVLNRVKHLHYQTVFAIALGLVVIAVGAQGYVLYNANEDKKKIDVASITKGNENGNSTPTTVSH